MAMVMTKASAEFRAQQQPFSFLFEDSFFLELFLLDFLPEDVPAAVGSAALVAAAIGAAMLVAAAVGATVLVAAAVGATVLASAAGADAATSAAGGGTNTLGDSTMLYWY